MLPALLLGVWTVLAAVTAPGPGPAGGARVAAPVSAAPALPARTDPAQRGVSARPETRRAAVAAVPDAAAQRDPGGHPPPAPADAAAPAALSAPPAPGGRVAAEPGRERAPPRPPHGPRQTRAPPFSTSG
ncbi:hypothetical protein CRV15_27440 [Streptomyces clavuligerus]|nr:hypothetical protein D1794_28085 [Streptomyces clavuligerus]QCS09010.1 hypothetical protein CRV15_27440 [Streptomyces clavuligerus]